MSRHYKTIHDASNVIHHTAIVKEGVQMGKRNYIGPFCIIEPNTVIGDDNTFQSHCVISSLPEHKDHFIVGTSFGVKIGNKNTFREFVTVNAGTERDTRIGDNNIMLRGSHLGHDVWMGDLNTLSCNVLIGGHSHIMSGVNMGLGSICHQYSLLGSFSMIGMGGIVTKKSEVRPFNIYVGNPIKYLKENTIGKDRANIDHSKEIDIEIVYEMIKQGKK